MATASQKTARTVSIDDFVSGLQKLTESDFTAVRGTLAYMRANPVDPETLKPYLFWNAQHYTRNLIDKTELYELLSLCWEPGMKSSIHNHKGQNCWMAAPMDDCWCRTTSCCRRIWPRITATSSRLIRRLLRWTIPWPSIRSIPYTT